MVARPGCCEVENRLMFFAGTNIQGEMSPSGSLKCWLRSRRLLPRRTCLGLAGETTAREGSSADAAAGTNISAGRLVPLAYRMPRRKKANPNPARGGTLVSHFQECIACVSVVGLDVTSRA